MDDDEEYARYQHAVASESQLNNEGGQQGGGRLTDTNDERRSNATNGIDEPEYDVMPEWDDAGGKSTIPEADYEGFEVEAVERADRNQHEQDSDDFKYYQHHFNMNRNHYRFWLNLKTDHERMEYLKEMKRQMHEPQDADNYTLEQQREKDLRQAREKLLKDVTTNEHINDFYDPNDANVRNRYVTRPHNEAYEEDQKRRIGREEEKRHIGRKQDLRKARDGKNPAHEPSPDVPSPGDLRPKDKHMFGEHGRDGHRARPPRGGFFEDPEIIREVVRQAREENAERARAREQQLNAAGAQVKEVDRSERSAHGDAHDRANGEEQVALLAPETTGIVDPDPESEDLGPVRAPIEQRNRGVNTFHDIADPESEDQVTSRHKAIAHTATEHDATELEARQNNSHSEQGLKTNDSDTGSIEETTTEGLRVLNNKTESENGSAEVSEHNVQYKHESGCGDEPEYGHESEVVEQSAKDHDSVSSLTGSFRSAARTFSAMQREVDELEERQQAQKAQRMKEEEQLTAEIEAGQAKQGKEQAHTADKSKQTFMKNNEALGEQVSPESISIAEKASSGAVPKERDALEEQVSPASTSKAKGSKEAAEGHKNAQPEEGVGIFTKYLREQRAASDKDAAAKKHAASNNEAYQKAAGSSLDARLISRTNSKNNRCPEKSREGHMYRGMHT